MIAKPTPENPNPDQYPLVRWIVFVVMVLTVFAVVWIGKRSKQTGGTRFAALEIIGGVVAAIAWAFLLPESPLAPHIDTEAYRVIIPLVIGFIAIMINVVIAKGLQNQST